MHDSGLITCKTSNKYGSTSSKAVLDVQVEREPENPPKWISRPRSVKSETHYHNMVELNTVTSKHMQQKELLL